MNVILGDRSPTATYPKDGVKPDEWKFGGGGLGQLSPVAIKLKKIFFFNYHP